MDHRVGSDCCDDEGVQPTDLADLIRRRRTSMLVDKERARAAGR